MWDALRGLVEHLNVDGSIHSRVGCPLSEPVERQGSASPGSHERLRFHHAYGYGRLAAASFKPYTTIMQWWPLDRRFIEPVQRPRTGWLALGSPRPLSVSPHQECGSYPAQASYAVIPDYASGNGPVARRCANAMASTCCSTVIGSCTWMVAPVFRALYFQSAHKFANCDVGQQSGGNATRFSEHDTLYKGVKFSA